MHVYTLIIHIIYTYKIVTKKSNYVYIVNKHFTYICFENNSFAWNLNISFNHVLRKLSLKMPLLKNPFNQIMHGKIYLFTHVTH